MQNIPRGLKLSQRVNFSETLISHCNFDKIPNEIIHKINSNLSTFDQLNCLPFVCKKWLEVKRAANKGKLISEIVDSILNLPNDYSNEMKCIFLKTLKSLSFIKELVGSNKLLSPAEQWDFDNNPYFFDNPTSKICDLERIIGQFDKTLPFELDLDDSLKSDERYNFSIGVYTKTFLDRINNSSLQSIIDLKAGLSLSRLWGYTTTHVTPFNPMTKMVSDMLQLELKNHVESLSDANLAYISQIIKIKDLSSKVFYQCNEFGRIDDVILTGNSILSDKIYNFDLSYSNVEDPETKKIYSFLTWETEDFNGPDESYQGLFTQYVYSFFAKKQIESSIENPLQTKVYVDGSNFSQILRWSVLSKTAEKLSDKLGISKKEKDVLVVGHG